MRRKGIWIGIGVLALMQLVQPDRSPPASDPAQHLEQVMAVPANVKIILAEGCYDCHSSNSNYPWYSYITPVNFWQQDHISDAREELNFSDWGTYSAKRIDKKLKEIKQEVSEGEMPLPSYTWIHADARLSDAQRKELVAFFEGLPH